MSTLNDITTRARARGMAMADRALELPGAHLMMRVLRDFLVNDVTDRAMTLAAQAFTSILPIVMLLTALPHNTWMTRALTGLGINPADSDLMSAPAPESLTIYGIIGALMTIAGATSLSRALGRMYVTIWHLTKLPMSGWWRWVVVIFLVPVAVAAQGFAAQLHGLSIFGVKTGDYAALGVSLEVLATFVIWTTLWAVLPRVLVSSQVPMRLLWVYGGVTGILVTVYLVGSRIFLPHILRETTHHFGTLGIVFVAISWLFFYAYGIVVVTIVLYTLLTLQNHVGVWMRTYLGVTRPLAAPESWVVKHDPDAPPRTADTG
ncbi:hypothetical protein AAFP30_16380 [Gordonia sp. CPCC 205515]|uniref:hypothetical protein n=1 Tax=Gordonia sp. CPCC 205515 TaxID=3140791 RepID=UPI003AF38109